MPANNFAAYFQDPVTGSNPLAALGNPTGTGAGGLPNWADPIGALLGGLGGSLFGGKEDKSDKWIRLPDGTSVQIRGSNKRNPVPASDIPSINAEPTRAYLQAANNVRALTDLLPYYSKAVAGQIIPQEEAKLAASEVTSPKYAELMTRLYEQYGPQLNQIGNDIARQNAMSQAERDRDVLAGPGQELIQQALEAAKLYDPEFFKTRETTAGRLEDLLGSIDLSGGLSETERREIEQGLAREGQQRGTAGAPNQTEIVGNAMRYGEAGRNRVTQNQNALSQAIAASTAFLPASRSGVDVFQVATGRSSGANAGENKFTGITTPGQEAYNMAGTLFGNAGANTLQNSQIDATKKLNEKDWLDQFSQFTGALGNLGSLAGGAFAMCWVAREVYGVNSPCWIIFRQWLTNRAPSWLRKVYMQYGQQFAWWLHDKPKLKTLIRSAMNNVISKNYGWNT